VHLRGRESPESRRHLPSRAISYAGFALHRRVCIHRSVGSATV